MPALLGTRRVPYLAGAWTPARLPGLALWLDAATVGQANNTSVALWRDRSGQHNDAVQGTVAAQPTYLAVGLNGRPALGFDGTDDVLLSVAAPTMQTWTLFVVGTLVGATQIALEVGKAGTANAYLGTGLTTPVSVRSGYEDSTAVYTDSSGASPASPAVIGGGYDGQTITSYANGARVGTTARAVAPQQPAGNQYILGAYAGNTQWWGGVLAGVLVYTRALAPGERHQVDAYLGARYGIAVTAG